MLGCFEPATPFDLESTRARCTPCENSGELVSVGRGVYRLAKAPALTNPDWVYVGLSIPRAVICLISALVYHELTTQVPHYVDIALPSHAQVPKLRGVPVRVFWYPERVFEAGIEVEIV